LKVRNNASLRDIFVYYSYFAYKKEEEREVARTAGRRRWRAQRDGGGGAQTGKYCNKEEYERKKNKEKNEREKKIVKSEGEKESINKKLWAWEPEFF
jgi:hypothetical protein